MNSASEVDALIEQLKAGGVPLSRAVWETACACVGWPYVFGAEGQKTTKDGITVRKFDCQGFTEWCLLQFGIDIRAAGATSQWNKDSLWAAKGSIDSIPDDILVCLFYRDKDNPNKMAHTGFGYKGQTCECSAGVQYFPERKAKWQYWAIPKGIEGGVIPVPTGKPTLRKGDRGEHVTELQTRLQELGYDIGKAGADGIFGSGTQGAVKAFQKDHGLTADGICGPKTWAALDAEEEKPAEDLYTVTIPGVTLEQAEELCGEWSGATMRKV